MLDFLPRFARVVRRLLTVFLRAVFLRGDLRLLGAALRFTVRLRVVFRLLGAAFLRVVFFLRVVLRLLGAAFLRVVFLRRVVFLLLGAAFRRATLLVDFLLAIVFLPFLVDFTLFFLLAEVFLFAALRFAGRRGFKITTSAKGIRSNLSHGGTTYKGRVLLYVRVIYL